MTTIEIWLIRIAGVLAIATMLAVGGYGFGYRRAADAAAAEKLKLTEQAAARQAALQAKVDADAKRLNDVAQQLEEARNARNQSAKVITKTVDRIVREPYYVDRPCLDADGLRVARAALAGRLPDAAADPGQPAAAVPSATGP